MNTSGNKPNMNRRDFLKTSCVIAASIIPATVVPQELREYFPAPSLGKYRVNLCPRVGLFGTGVAGINVIEALQTCQVAGITRYIASSSDKNKLDLLCADEKILIGCRSRDYRITEAASSFERALVECFREDFLRSIEDLSAVIVVSGMVQDMPDTGVMSFIVKIANESGTPILKIVISEQNRAATVETIANRFNTSEPHSLLRAISNIKNCRGWVSDIEKLRRVFEVA